MVDETGSKGSDRCRKITLPANALTYDFLLQCLLLSYPHEPPKKTLNKHVIHYALAPTQCFTLNRLNNHNRSK